MLTKYDNDNDEDSLPMPPTRRVGCIQMKTSNVDDKIWLSLQTGVRADQCSSVVGAVCCGALRPVSGNSTPLFNEDGACSVFTHLLQ